MNCKLLSVAVFLTLMLTSLLAGRHNYCKARNEITADLNQALAQTSKREKIISLLKIQSGRTNNFARLQADRY